MRLRKVVLQFYDEFNKNMRINNIHKTRKKVHKIKIN